MIIYPALDLTMTFEFEKIAEDSRQNHCAHYVSHMMGNHPRKHIGILTNGEVWHYSNTNNRVVSHSLEHFKNTFRSVYATSGTTVEFYYGKFL